jgi:ComF family protein
MRVLPGDAQTDDEVLGEIDCSTEVTLLPCPRCQTRQSPHLFQRITPLYRYHDAARDAVVAAKYPRNSAVSRELALRLADRLRNRWSDLLDAPERKDGQNGSASLPLVTSVPAPWLRQLRRGGSGTRLLAQYTARELGLSYANLLQTTRQIRKQALLQDDQRQENVRGAFRIRRPWLKKLQGREILLVDDVMTTGATADELAGVLMAAGATRVSLAVVALAMRDS